jgi:hypothetical protein
VIRDRHLERIGLADAPVLSLIELQARFDLVELLICQHSALSLGGWSLERPAHPSQDGFRRRLKRVSPQEQLGQIDTALTDFSPVDSGLADTDPVGKLALRQAGMLAGLTEGSGEGCVVGL